MEAVRQREEADRLERMKLSLNVRFNGDIRRLQIMRTATVNELTKMTWQLFGLDGSAVGAGDKGADAVVQAATPISLSCIRLRQVFNNVPKRPLTYEPRPIAPPPTHTLPTASDMDMGSISALASEPTLMDDGGQKTLEEAGVTAWMLLQIETRESDAEPWSEYDPQAISLKVHVCPLALENQRLLGEEGETLLTVAFNPSRTLGELSALLEQKTGIVRSRQRIIRVAHSALSFTLLTHSALGYAPLPLDELKSAPARAQVTSPHSVCTSSGTPWYPTDPSGHECGDCMSLSWDLHQATMTDSYEIYIEEMPADNIPVTALDAALRSRTASPSLSPLVSPDASSSITAELDEGDPLGTPSSQSVSTRFLLTDGASKDSPSEGSSAIPSVSFASRFMQSDESSVAIVPANDSLSNTSIVSTSGAHAASSATFAEFRLKDKVSKLYSQLGTRKLALSESLVLQYLDKKDNVGVWEIRKAAGDSKDVEVLSIPETVLASIRLDTRINHVQLYEEVGKAINKPVGSFHLFKGSSTGRVLRMDSNAALVESKYASRDGVLYLQNGRPPTAHEALVSVFVAVPPAGVVPGTGWMRGIEDSHCSPPMDWAPPPLSEIEAIHWASDRAFVHATVAPATPASDVYQPGSSTKFISAGSFCMSSETTVSQIRDMITPHLQERSLLPSDATVDDISNRIRIQSKDYSGAKSAMIAGSKLGNLVLGAVTENTSLCVTVLPEPEELTVSGPTPARASTEATEDRHSNVAAPSPFTPAVFSRVTSPFIIRVRWFDRARLRLSIAREVALPPRASVHDVGTTIARLGHAEEYLRSLGSLGQTPSFDASLAPVDLGFFVKREYDSDPTVASVAIRAKWLRFAASSVPLQQASLSYGLSDGCTIVVSDLSVPFLPWNEMDAAALSLKFAPQVSGEAVVPSLYVAPAITAAEANEPADVTAPLFGPSTLFTPPASAFPGVRSTYRYKEAGLKINFKKINGASSAKTEPDSSASEPDSVIGHSADKPPPPSLHAESVTAPFPASFRSSLAASVASAALARSQPHMSETGDVLRAGSTVFDLD
jgi:hypothetical protein